jgi:hypothetical protein
MTTLRKNQSLEYYLPSGFHMVFLGSMGESVREPGRPIRGDSLLAIAADIMWQDRRKERRDGKERQRKRGRMTTRTDVGGGGDPNGEVDAKARGKWVSQQQEWSLVSGKCDGVMMVMMIAMMMAPRCGCG